MVNILVYVQIILPYKFNDATTYKERDHLYFNSKQGRSTNNK